ncbi:MAG: hypothetical protein HY687_05425 [Chloroflexi bacterium]|nr:hypothetical protein [Chloroflexota bacterium]
MKLAAQAEEVAVAVVGELPPRAQVRVGGSRDQGQAVGRLEGGAGLAHGSHLQAKAGGAAQGFGVPRHQAHHLHGARVVVGAQGLASGALGRQLPP